MDMHDERKGEGKLSRRHFLRSGGAGICLFYLSNLFGCAPTTEEPRRNDEDEPPEAPLTAKKGFTNPVRSPWFTELNDGKIRCDLCPRQCELRDGERAPCRVRENRGGTGYTLAYGNPALLQEDPIERKPFFHVLPGSRAFSISTAGCNLDCKFCEVWDMALEYPEEVYAHDVSPERVLQHAQESGVQSISYAFGEPIIFYEYMSEITSLASEAGLLNLVHTAGYVQQEPLRELLGQIDAVNVDLKSFNEAFYKDVVGGELQPVLDTLRLLRENGVHIEITNILIPGQNDDMTEIAEMCTWIAEELGSDIPLHFVRFYPLYKMSEIPRTPVSTLTEAHETAQQAGLKFVYISRVSDHEAENTFCPACGEKIIDRLGFVIEEVNMVDGRCAYCDEEIPGRWE